MNLRFTLAVAILLIFSACGSNNIDTTGTEDFAGYELSAIENTNAFIAEKRSAQGTILENGIVRNNHKDGMWVTYYDDERKNIKSITSYVDGKKSGGHFEFSNRGQLESKTGYISDQLHGMTGTYNFGRPKSTTEYKYGQFHGQHIEYYGSGKIQKLSEFKDGKQHGLIQYYDEQGKITLEYQYKDGEKISGGIVNTPSENK